MRNQRFIAQSSGLLGVLLVVFSSIASAHPHYWVNVQVKLDLDNQGRLIALQQEWHFDDFVSAILLDEMESIVPGRPPLSVLASESQRIVGDLAPFNYYTHVKVAGKEISVPAPKSHFLKVLESDGGSADQPRQKTNLLVLTMRFEWPQPVALNAQSLTLSVYDPTYYASFNHHSTEQVVVAAPSNLACKTDLRLPNPDESMIAYAFSLDQSQRDTQGLGQHFAEQVTVDCEGGLSR